MSLEHSPPISSISSRPLRLRTVTRERGSPYLVSHPAEAHRGASATFPLILSLHGAGERGSNLLDVTRHGLARLLSGSAELSPAEAEIARDVAARFIVIAPQCAHYEVWHDADLLQLLDEVAQDFAIDPTRIYLTGLSMGGFGTWTLGLRHPRRFAALVPICGGGRIADVTAAMKNEPDALRTLGVWAFHGARDRIVPLEESERMVAAMHSAGLPDVKLTVYPEAEHDSWTPAYATPELYTWLLAHRRS